MIRTALCAGMLFAAALVTTGCTGADVVFVGGQCTGTDVNCGGDCPDKCANNLRCNVGSDCQSDICNLGICSAPTCNDGIKNGDETDVDCGGSCPNKCANGQGCEQANDCQSGVCDISPDCSGESCSKQCLALRYTVTYDGNGNTEGEAPTDANNYEQGMAVTVADAGTLTKSGSTFIGWNTAADGSGTSQTAGSTFEMGTANVTVYAQWAINQYTVTPGAGADGSIAPSTVQTVNYGNTTSFTVTPSTGYYIYSVMGCAGALAGDTFTTGAITANCEVTATFAINTYTLTYTAGSNGSITGTSPQMVNYSASGTAVTALPATGYHFMQWSDDSTQNPRTDANVTADISVTASFAINQYTVTFDKNGGDTDANPTSISTDYNTTATLPTPPTKTGYTFASWNTASGGGGTTFTAATPVIANITVYAQWTINQYTVTFDKNGGDTDANPTSKTTDYNTTVTLPTPPTKTGYTFTSWNTASGGGGTTFTTATPVTANITVYAQWTINTYTVTYDGNGSTSGDIPTDPNHYLQGATVTVAPSSTFPVKSGSTFAGWNTAADGSGTHYSMGATFEVENSNVTLYVQWSSDPAYTVTYDGHGSSGGTLPTDTNHYLQGMTVTVAAAGTLVKAGSTFAGWNTAANGSGTSYAAGSTFEMGTANVILYAQWTVITYTVNYDGNGQIGGDVPTDTHHYIPGATATVVCNTGNLVNVPLYFGGWNTAADGSGTNYSPRDTFVMGASNVTLYAKWVSSFVVGDMGPACGWIFYVDNVVPKLLPNGITYLEAAPINQTSQVWSNIQDQWAGTSGIGAWAIGMGYSNTLTIMAQAGHTTSAAKVCADLELNGFNDWFLPSLNELYMMYTALYSHVPSLGGFASAPYWSSTEGYAKYGAYSINFSINGDGLYTGKWQSILIRAARRF